MKPKYIRVCSDLHLEFYKQPETLLVEKFVPADEKDKESILVLAGDISSRPDQLINFFNLIKDRFIKIIYVPGNHEYYGHEMFDLTMTMNSKLVLNNLDEKVLYSGCGVELEELDGVRFIYTTLWADGGATAVESINIGLSLRDFYVTKLGDKKFTVSNMQELHKAQKEKIGELLEIPFEGKTVVVTHHLPSHSLCHPRFGSEINGGFASHCDMYLAGEHAPDMWIHGHTHDTIDKMLFDTRIVCNPAGYNSEWNTPFNSYFSALKFIEIENIK